MAQDVGELSGRVAQLDIEVAGVKEDIAALNTSVGNLGQNVRGDIARLFDRIEVANKRETPWGLILTAGGIMSAGGIGLCGLFLTLILALSAWANSYFGQRIEAAQQLGNQALAHQTKVANEVDTVQAKVNTLEAQRDAAKGERDRLQATLDTFAAKLDADRDYELQELRRKMLALPPPAGG